MKWKCAECGDEFETEPERHVMRSCECGESAVDHEEDYMRFAGTSLLSYNPETGEYEEVW